MGRSRRHDPCLRSVFPSIPNISSIRTTTRLVVASCGFSCTTLRTFRRACDHQSYVRFRAPRTVRRPNSPLARCFRQIYPAQIIRIIICDSEPLCLAHRRSGATRSLLMGNCFAQVHSGVPSQAGIFKDIAARYKIRKGAHLGARRTIGCASDAQARSPCACRRSSREIDPRAVNPTWAHQNRDAFRSAIRAITPRTARNSVRVPSLISS